MSPMRYFLFVMPFLLGSAGRVLTTPYPDNWSPIVPSTTSQCPDLTGSYENFGVQARASYVHEWDLVSFFFNASIGRPKFSSLFREMPAITHVTFDDQGGDGIVIKAWVGDELFTERRIIAPELSCLEGHLVYREDVGASASYDRFGSTDYTISVASDGSLVIGSPSVNPVIGSIEAWYAFPQTSSNTPNLHTNTNSPQGVRGSPTPAYRLLPPAAATQTSKTDAKVCLEEASKAGEPPDPQALALLGGRSTQAFIYQLKPDGQLYPDGAEYPPGADYQPPWAGVYPPGRFLPLVQWDWLPVTHPYRIEKLHWQSPSVADHYVICLLRKGYKWEDL